MLLGRGVRTGRESGKENRENHTVGVESKE